MLRAYVDAYFDAAMMMLIFLLLCFSDFFFSPCCAMPGVPVMLMPLMRADIFAGATFITLPRAMFVMPPRMPPPLTRCRRLLIFTALRLPLDIVLSLF